MIVITGTDTNVGKTLVSSWLCLHTRWAYFKPIQTGVSEGCDKDVVASLSHTLIYPEIYTFEAPVSPHLAAHMEQQSIDVAYVNLPAERPMIIEGAGGVCVPVNETDLMLDVFIHLNRPIILVASARLGTINHTLLSIQAIRDKNLTLLGVIMTGDDVLENQKAIEHYGKTQVLAVLPWLSEVSTETLRKIPLPMALQILLSEFS